MPVPNTGGQLRSKIADMQVGDYIPYRWLDSKYNFEVGTIGTTEVPVTGTAWLSNWNNYYGYMIKVDKGLLVSDRVFAHSGSWDAINSRKWIQGYAMDNGNIIPTMTSNTAPSGVASASSELTPAWRAFDGVLTNVNPWLATTTTGWLGYEFPTATTIRGYSILGQDGYQTRSPKNWTFEGSNDGGATWMVIDSRSNVTGWTDATFKMFLLPASVSYKKYRINVTTNAGDANYLAISELKMFENVGIIRSLGGGCAYADASGNPVTTDQGLGAAPIDNEWDTYIVKKDYGTGAGRDDVWHWNNISTWCQETAMLNMPWGTGTVDNTYRMARGRLRNNSVDYKAGTATSPAQGFRPVFEVTP